MTCIVAIKTKSYGVIMGGDASANWGDLRTQLATSKVWKTGAMLVGAAGSIRPANVVRQIVGPKKAPRHPSLYLLNDYIPRAIKALNLAGWVPEKPTDQLQGCMLIGLSGRIFEIGCDWGLCESSDNYAAIGSGCQVALGSLGSNVGLNGRSKVLEALRVTAKHTGTVNEPFTVEVER